MTHVYSVNQCTGALSTKRSIPICDDHRGYLVKLAVPGQAVEKMEKMVYDGSGREVNLGLAHHQIVVDPPHVESLRS